MGKDHARTSMENVRLFSSKMEKLKILPPTQRDNRRYILLSINNKKKIEKAILDYIGVLGWAKAAPQFIEEKNGPVLAINHDSLDNVRAALELAGINCLGVSGTIKKLKDKFMDSSIK